MIGNILHTFGSKLLVAAISLITLLLNAQYLGAKGLGTVGLIVLNITLVILICNLVHGSIIYFSSRLNSANLTLVSYLWTFISLLVYYIINSIYPLIEDKWEVHIYGLSFLQASASIHFYLLLGEEKVKSFNRLSLLQSVITIGTLAIGYLLFEIATVSLFVNALYLAYGSVWLVGLLISIKYLPSVDTSSLTRTLKASLGYGIYVQAANTFQLLNYRISYFFLDTISGRISLGHYTAGVQLSESLLIPGRSISTVQYARISKKQQDSYAKRITLFFMKVSFLITLLGTIAILLIPISWFTLLLGSEFRVVKLIILSMSFGIIALSAEIVLSHYFSGTGRQKMNMISAFIGLLVTIIGCSTLIEPYGAIGAALTTALSYSSMFLFLFILMNKQKEVRLVDFVPNRRDFRVARRLWWRITN